MKNENNEMCFCDLAIKACFWNTQLIKGMLSVCVVTLNYYEITQGTSRAAHNDLLRLII